MITKTHYIRWKGTSSPEQRNLVKPVTNTMKPVATVIRRQPLAVNAEMAVG